AVHSRHGLLPPIVLVNWIPSKADSIRLRRYRILSDSLSRVPECVNRNRFGDREHNPLSLPCGRRKGPQYNTGRFLTIISLDKQKQPPYTSSATKRNVFVCRAKL
ncbi:MAG: hypothetical protein V2A34_09520, partial [Lentisphaerota bacterium]